MHTTLTRSHKSVARWTSVALIGLILAAILGLAGAHAAGGTNVVAALQNGNVYVSPLEIKAGRAKAGDAARLNAQASRAASQGVPQKFAIVHNFPSYDVNTAGAAHDLRNTLGFSGVLVVVSPRGIGISSNSLSSSEDTAIAQRARPRCLTQGFASCAVFAGQQAVTQVKADQSSSSRGAGIFWAIVLVIFGGVIALVVWSVARRRRRLTQRLDELRGAASNTLSLADNAVGEIEGSGVKMSPDTRTDYDRALGLRDQARKGLEGAATPEMLSQANQDAAQSVLALQGVMKKAGIKSTLVSPLDVEAHKCFYCGREDRPPYTKKTIEDGKGNSMDVEVCSVCAAQLAEGRTPQVATVNYQGSNVPWWAVPGNPWYYGYGGPTWQYWLPFFVGMDVGSWFGGGWGYGPGWGYDGGTGWGDAGGAGFGGDSGGGGWSDAGGADFGGGDFGGGDTGGADFGGGDSGGSGWS